MDDGFTCGGKMAVVGGDPLKLPMERSFNFLTLFLHSFEHDPARVNTLFKYYEQEQRVLLKFTDMLKSSANVEQEEEDQPHLQVQVDFYPHKIIYQYGEHVVNIDDEHLVHYIYNLMDRMNFWWMGFVCYKMLGSRCATLKDRCMDFLFQYTSEGVSVLRHQLSSAQSIIFQLSELGRMLDLEEVKEKFVAMNQQRGLFNGHVLLNRDNLYSTSLPLHGNHSLLGRVELMAHLLLMEAVLMSHHKWEEVYADCYHCQVEGFHFYLWREIYDRVNEYYIFFDVKIWKQMIPHGIRIPRLPCVNMYTTMHQFEVNWRHHFLEDFLYPHFFFKTPMKVRTLKQLAKDECVSNVVMARFEILYSMGLEAVDLAVEYPEREHYFGPFILHFLPVMAYVKDTYEELMNRGEYVLKGTVYKFPSPSSEDYVDILKRACKLPLTHHLSVLRISTNFINNHYKRMKQILQLSGY